MGDRSSFSPTVNGQGLYSISPLRKYGRVTHPQSTDRVYTVFRLLERMGELLTHSQRTALIHHFAFQKAWAIELLAHSQRTGFIQHFAS